MGTNIKAIRSKLLAGIKSVMGAVKGDKLDSVFGFVKVDTMGEDCVLVSACDSETLVTSRVFCEVEKPGAMLVAGGRFLSFVGALPEGHVEIDMAASATFAKITGGVTGFSVCRRDVGDFPAMALPDAEKAKTFTVSGMRLAEMIRKTRFAACVDKTRAVLCGVCLEIKDDVLSMVAADSRRLSCVQVDPGACGFSFNVVLPMNAVKQLATLIKAYDETRDITVRVEGGHCSFTADLWSLTTVLVAGVFPNWRMVLDAKSAGEPFTLKKVDRKLMLEGLQRSMLAMNRDEMNCRVTIRDSRIQFSARSTMGVCATTMPVDYAGDEFTFHVNPQLVMDVLEAIDDDFVDITLSGPNAPIRITCSVPYVSIVQQLRKED